MYSALVLFLSEDLSFSPSLDCLFPQDLDLCKVWTGSCTISAALELWFVLNAFGFASFRIQICRLSTDRKDFQSFCHDKGHEGRVTKFGYGVIGLCGVLGNFCKSSTVTAWRHPDNDKHATYFLKATHLERRYDSFAEYTHWPERTLYSWIQSGVLMQGCLTCSHINVAKSKYLYIAANTYLYMTLYTSILYI